MKDRNEKAKRREPIDRRQLSRLFEQLPPHALEAEMSLLGAMLIAPRSIGDVVLVLRTGEDFYKQANGVIFDTMVDSTCSAVVRTTVCACPTGLPIMWTTLHVSSTVSPARAAAAQRVTSKAI